MKVRGFGMKSKDCSLRGAFSIPGASQHRMKSLLLQSLLCRAAAALAIVNCILPPSAFSESLVESSLDESVSEDVIGSDTGARGLEGERSPSMIPKLNTPAETTQVAESTREAKVADSTAVRAGRFSLGLAFGSQASPFGREAAGFLYGVSQNAWTGLFIQAGMNEETGKAAYGAHLEWGVDLARRAPSALSLVATVAFGGSEDRELLENSRQVGGSIGIQLEVELLAAISTALRVEIGGQFLPADSLRVSTSSSEVLVYYHLNP